MKDFERNNSIVSIKIGGTSTPLLDTVSALAREHQRYDEFPVVTLSAFAGITNALIEVCDRIDGKRPGDPHALIDDIMARHKDTVGNFGLLDAPTAIANRHGDVAETPLWQAYQDVDTQLQEGISAHVNRRDTGHGVMSLEAREPFITAGETLSGLSTVAKFRSDGMPAVFVPGEVVFETDANFGSAFIQLPESKAKGEPVLRRLIESKIIPVLTGFRGENKGRITSLGRNASNESAVAVAGVLPEIREVFINTDVDGVYTIDPNDTERGQDAEHITDLPIDDALQMAATNKVLHMGSIEMLNMLNTRRRVVDLIVRRTSDRYKEGRSTRVFKRAS